ncbi:MAG: hypothetical protein ACJ8EF_06795 [Bradyrhizobium sp.]
MIDLQQGLRDPRLQFWFRIEFCDHALGHLPDVKVDVVLNRDIDLDALPVKAGEPRQAIQGLSDLVQPR